MIFHLFNYLLYCLLFFLIHSAFISTVVYFHFHLGHQFNAIGEWTLRYGWELIISTKLMAFYLAIRTVGIRATESKGLVSFLQEKFQGPKRNIFVVATFLFLSLVLPGRPAFVQENLSLENFGVQVLSFIGVGTFYLSDYVVLAYSRYLVPLEGRREKIIFYMLFPALFYLSTIVTIPYMQKDDFFLSLHFLTCLLFLELAGTEISHPFTYIFILVAPLSAFLGLDPLWKNQFSFINIQKTLPLGNYVVLWSLSFLYLFFTEGKLGHPKLHQKLYKLKS